MYSSDIMRSVYGIEKIYTDVSMLTSQPRPAPVFSSCANSVNTSNPLLSQSGLLAAWLTELNG